MRKIKENKHRSDELKGLQSLPLKYKVMVAQARIQEFIEDMDSKIYVSFSGGKDSTVLLDLVREIKPDAKAAFIDTGLEYPEIRAFAKQQENIDIIKPKMSFRKVIETYGYPLIAKEIARNIYYGRKALEAGNMDAYAHYIEGKRKNPKTGEIYSFMKPSAAAQKLLESSIPVSDHCCTVMKKSPAHIYETETGTHPFIGTMAEESVMRQRHWLQNGCNITDGRRPHSNPLSIWTEQDILQYLKEKDLPYCSVYGEIKQDENGKYYTTGCTRTGCIFCGFGCTHEKEPNRFQKLKQTHPQLWEYCMKPWDNGGLGMREVLEYIDVKVE